MCKKDAFTVRQEIEIINVVTTADISQKTTDI